MSGPAVLAQINQATGFGSQPSNVSDPYNILSHPAAPSAPAASSGPDYSSLIASLQAQTAALNRQYQAQYTPYFNTYQNYLNAGNVAQSVVNPLYTQKLNDYLAQEAVNTQRQQTDTGTALAQIQTGLGDTLAASGVQRDRASQDAATNTAQIANTQQNYLQDQGTAFDNARMALLKGQQDTGSGLSAQATGTAQTAHNTAESRQLQTNADQTTAQGLAKTRTYEDLSTSDAIANRTAGTQTSAANLSLSRYIQDAATQEQAQRNDLESQRLQAVYAEQNRQAQLGTQRFLSTLSGTAYTNAVKAYG
jgi:hypothetical protein